MDLQTVIRLEGIIKTYRMGMNSVKVLQGVTLCVNRGEMVAIMGPSGSGKSTLLNIIGCLDTPSDGKYILDGIDVSDMSRDQLATIRNQKIGFIFQGFNLLGRTDALANVQLPLLYADDNRRLSPKEIERRALEALSWVGLKNFGHHMPNQLSGGQQQRVAIARALVNNPSIILADEPTGALDSRTSIEVIDIIQKLNLEKNITVVMVTHEQQIALYCQRIIRVRDGIIQDCEHINKPGIAAADLQNMPREVES